MDEMHCLVRLLRPRAQQTKPNPKAVLAQRMTINYQSYKEQESVIKENPNFSLSGQILDLHCP